MTVMTPYQAVHAWLQASTTAVDEQALRNLIAHLQREKATAVQAFKEADAFIARRANPQAPIYDARRVRAMAQQRLRVMTPALRYANTLLSHMKATPSMPNLQRLHTFLLARMAGVPDTHLTQGPAKFYVAKTYPVAMEQQTALDLLTGHPGVFGDLPDWVPRLAAQIKPGPMSMTLDRLIGEDARHEFLQAKKQLLDRVRAEMPLSSQELATLNRL